MVGGMFSLLRSLTMCKISSYRFESSDEPLRGLHDHLEAGVSCHRAGMHTVVAASDYFWLGVFINNYLEAHSTISQGCAGGSRSFRKFLVEHNSISPSNCHIQHSYNLLFFFKVRTFCTNQGIRGCHRPPSLSSAGCTHSQSDPGHSLEFSADFPVSSDVLRPP